MDLKDYIVSIDLGCSKVVAALGKLDANGEVVVADLVSKPMEGFIRGEISNIEQVTTALKAAINELESRNNIIVNEVMVSASGKHIVCDNTSGFVYVGSDGEILEENVKQLYENMHNVQAPDGKVILSRIPQNFKIDSREITTTPVGMYGKKLEATFGFVLAGKAVLERIGKAFDRVGIKERKFVAAASASAEVVATDDEKEVGVAVIDLGAGTTNLAIYHDKVLRYVASIPMGQDAINKDIKAAAIPERSIEKLKTSFGYATASVIPFDRLNSAIRINRRSQHEKDKDIPYRDLCTIINARMLDIVEFIIDELRASGYQNSLGAGIILTGGGSQLMGVDTLLKERTGQDVRLGYAEVGVSANSVEGCSNPALATAIGLLRVGMEGEQLRVMTPKADIGKQQEVVDDEVKSDGGDDNKEQEESKEQGKKRGGKKKEPKSGSGKKWFGNFIKRIDEAIFGQEIVGDEDI